MPARVFSFVFMLMLLLPMGAMAETGRATFFHQFRQVEVLDPPVMLNDITLSGQGGPVPISTWRGKWLVLNIWATWCAPCVAELPQINLLRMMRAGPQFDIAAVSIDSKLDADRVAYFLQRYEAGQLTPLHDTARLLPDRVKTDILPITYVIDPEGRAVLALRGPAKWSSQSAVDFADALVGRGLGAFNGEAR